MPKAHSFTQPLTRHYLMDIPAGKGPFPLIIACHGYSQRPASMMRFVQLWAKNCIVVSLQGPFPHHRTTPPGKGRRPYGFGWISSYNPQESIELHCNAINQIIDDITAKETVIAEQVFLAGFSQSVSLNYRYAFRGERKLAGLISIMGALPSDLDDLNKTTLPKTLVVGSEKDIHYPKEIMHGFVEKLLDLKTDVSSLWYKKGHEYPIDLDAQISQWLEFTLNKPSN